MNAANVMTRNVITISSDASIREAIRLMLQHRISGLPVLDRNGSLVGIVTEGDLLRRTEIDTQPRRARWLAFLMGPGRLSEEYAHSSGRKVHEVMNTDVRTISEDTPLSEIVQTMEQHRIKRLPVVKDSKLVGIVARSNLLHALASVAREVRPVAGSDETIRQAMTAELQKQTWVPINLINVIVRNGVVHLWGTILDERQRKGIRVIAENTPGVKAVEDHLVWVEPMSGMVMLAPEEETAAGATN
jgi:CBS-domain-containing membrane protein